MTADPNLSSTAPSLRFAKLRSRLTAPRRPGAAWTVLADSEIRRLHDELDLTEVPFAVAGVTDLASEVYLEKIRTIVRRHLKQAEEALVPGNRAAAFRAWYTGVPIEQAWLNIHRAGEMLVMIQSPGSLIREYVEIDAAFRASIAAGDPRYANLAGMLAEVDLALSKRPPRSDPFSATLRSKLKAVRNVANVASDTTHETVRRWRNLLVLGGIVLGVLSIVVSLVHILVPNFISLAPPGGWGRGSSVQPWEVILLGSVGGALAAVLALNRFSGFTDPSGLPVVQALLRIPTAAATSLIGVLLMQTATLDVLKPQHGATVLTYGFFFGYAQEPLLRAIDRRAGMVLDPARNKDEPASTIPAAAAPAATTPVGPDPMPGSERPPGKTPPASGAEPIH